MNKKLIGSSFLLALGESAYIFLVALFMFNAERLLGSKPEPVGMVAFLLLFVTSAAVSGALILGKPILLYLEGRKSESIKLFFAILAWLLIFLTILLFTM